MSKICLTYENCYFPHIIAHNYTPDDSKTEKWITGSNIFDPPSIDQEEDYNFNSKKLLFR